MRYILLGLLLYIGNVLAADDAVLRIYDISQRLPAHQIFPGPEVKLGYSEPPPPHVQKILDQWIQQIHSANPEAWREKGVGIELRGGRLMVIHRRAIHKQVAEILGFEDEDTIVPKEKK